MPEQELADRLEVGLAPLDLLGDGVHVAEPESNGLSMKIDVAPPAWCVMSATAFAWWIA